MIEIGIRSILCLWALLFTVGVLTKWSSKDFEIGDVFVILFVIMFMSVAIGG